MTQQETRGSWSFWKQQLATLWMVGSFMIFMNADSVPIAVAGGAVGLVGIVFMIVQKRRSVATLAEPVFKLGPMTASAPERMRGWYMLGVAAFVLLGVVMAFGPAEATPTARLGMTSICLAIAGSFLVIASPRLRRPGLLFFGLGFLVAGGLFMWASFETLRGGGEDAPLTATKWFVFALFVLCGGIPTTIGALLGGGGTPVYQSGVGGPYGFVTWEAAEKVDVVNQGGTDMLAVGAYRGWTLWIQIPESSRGAVEEFVRTTARPLSETTGENCTEAEPAEGHRPD